MDSLIARFVRVGVVCLRVSFSLFKLVLFVATGTEKYQGDSQGARSGSF